MARYTKKDADGRYYIESVNGKLESDKFGHTYGEAIDRFAELENADVAPRAEIVGEIFEEIEKILDDSTIVSSSDWGRPYFNITNFRFGIFRLKTKYKEGQK